ncbi:MAG: hypothetical protein K9J27_03615, partial [Bacteroidales bacterium]|nr:hypothetical protein [Bacteroidales bacterium]MCF8332868.1 hypothetical protein [Bacteroidales bacterium]
MRKLTFLTAFLMFCSMGFSQAYDIMIGGEQNAKEVVTDNYSELRMNYSYEGITSFNVKTDKGKFTEIRIPGAYFT